MPESPEFKPYVAPETQMAEFNWQTIVVGALLGILFGASSVYLVLKVGMTVSASIPVAVLSITLFRWLGSKTTILENNIVQTTGSAGESIAFGVGVTMPALMLIGFEMDFTRVMVVSLLGGLLGILMMIPLRRAFIVQMHGKAGEPNTLVYPEGTACAQVLISGDKGGASGKTVFIGFGLAFFHKLIGEGLSLLATSIEAPLKLGRDAVDAFSRVGKVSLEFASELLGVGYIIGVRTSSIMMAGAVVGSLVVLPAIAQGGPDVDAKTLGDWLKNIGAGCVAAAGIISMGKTLPMIVRSFASGLQTLKGAKGGADRTLRTEDDLPPSILYGGMLFLLAVLTIFLAQEFSPVAAFIGAGLVLLFGFLFVTVSSRLTGEIGSSSNPISGMTVATLLMTCLIFLAMGMTSPLDAVLALSIGGVVCIAASNGGTTSQDLKTGFLVGATPRLQQWAILIGALTSALVIGGILLLFNSVGIVYSQRNLPNVNVKELVSKEMPEKLDYEGESFHIWRPSKKVSFPSLADATKNVEVAPGKYLVDTEGFIVYKIDPTITGTLEQQDRFVPLDKADELGLKDEERQAIESARITAVKGETALPEASALRDQAGKPLKVYALWTNNEATHLKKKKELEQPGSTKKVFPEPFIKQIPEREYLVGDDGKITHVNRPTSVRMKFPAPKTQVMATIINGLLTQDLNWALIAIGACIAIALELCGVSSLAFAVGLYVPMKYSTPIFLGGIARWFVDSRTQREQTEQDEAAQIVASETSPAMLMASGLIAGGSIAGVLLAFLNFLPKGIQDALNLEAVSKAVFAPLGGSLVNELLALVVFIGLAVVLYLVGVGKLFAVKGERPT